jgi:hypothetical protein
LRLRPAHRCEWTGVTWYPLVFVLMKA